MKRTNYSIGILSVVLTAVMFLSSCGTTSVTQRRYNKGLHIEWASKSKVKSAETVKVSEKNRKTPVSGVACEEETVVSVAQSEVVVEEITLNENVEMNFENKNTEKALTSKSKSVKIFKSLKQSKTEDIADNDFVTAKSFSKKTFLKAVAAKKSSSDLGTLLLVIIAIIIPPLAVYLYEGSWTSRVTLNLILTLGALLIGGVLIIGSLWFSLYIIPIIHALIVILS